MPKARGMPRGGGFCGVAKNPLRANPQSLKGGMQARLETRPRAGQAKRRFPCAWPCKSLPALPPRLCAVVWPLATARSAAAGRQKGIAPKLCPNLGDATRRGFLRRSKEVPKSETQRSRHKAAPRLINLAQRHHGNDCRESHKPTEHKKKNCHF